VRADQLERRIGLLLGAATAAGAALLILGVVAMVVAGVDPLTRPYPAFDPARAAADLAALRPAGLVWLGLVAVILTPALRVVAALAGFAVTGERWLTGIAAAVLAVMLLSAVLGYGG
jgi:uncharacterized membrane protein